MEQIKCIECGTFFYSTLEECPNCGCPASVSEKVIVNSIEKENLDAYECNNSSPSSSQSLNQESCVEPRPQNSLNLKNHPQTQGYYPWWSLTRPWYIDNEDGEKEQHRFDMLNEIFLLANLCWRVSLWWLLFIHIAVIVSLAPLSMMRVPILMPFGFGLLILIWGTCIIWGFPWPISRYWVKIHKLWRRINQRYWISMKHAQETGLLEDF